VTDSPAFSLRAPLLVRSPNWLGDAIMALPAVRNLKIMMGGGSLTIAVPEKLAALWQACPFVDQVIPLTDPKSAWRTAGQLRPGKFGAAVLLPNSLRAAGEVLLAGIPQRIGYATDGRRLLLSKAVPVPRRNPVRLHQRYYYLDLVTALGGPSDDSLPDLKIDAKPTDQIALCPGAEFGPAKRWPVERFAAVAQHFAVKHNLNAVILGAPNDVPVAAELAKLLPDAKNLAGSTSLPEFITTLAASKLVISNDSGAMHLASALGVPTVAIFGSTEPQMTGPLGPRARVLRHHVPCSPCFFRFCPIDFACMTSITPEMVIAQAEQLLPFAVKT
jgi:heptosyltransferase-2